MLSTHELWDAILKCDTQSEMSVECWEKIRFIAKNMIEEDFTCGSRSDRGEKLANALGYDGLNALKEVSNFENKVKFLNEFALYWNDNMNLCGVFNATIGKKSGVHPRTDQSLRNKFYDVINSLGIKTIRTGDRYSPLVESLLLFFCDEAHENATPMETYKRWKENHAALVARIRQQRRRKSKS